MEEYVLLKWIFWGVVVLFTISFIYFSFFKHGVSGIISSVVKRFHWVLTIFGIALVVSFLVGTFDSGVWYNVDSFGIDGCFFLWVALIATLVVSLFVVLWECALAALVFALFGIVLLLLYPFGIRFNFGKFKVYKAKVKNYKHVSSDYTGCLTL